MTKTHYQFTVDAKLLRELGERLVGRPHIALAELVKNAYDADARRVEIAFNRGQIVVTDDGHGMSPGDFLNMWMRVGTTHKERDRVSPSLKRPMTGSKGVGRLAVQLLARNTRVTSVGLSDPRENLVGPNHDLLGLERQIDATIDWDQAVNSGDLTGVTVPVELKAADQLFANNSRHGTRVELSRLVHRWDPVRFRRLAQEIWGLQPPFEVSENDPDAFTIVLTTGYKETYRRFDEQMRALMDIWSARITGKLRPMEAAVPEDSLDVIELPNLLPSADVDQDLEEAGDQSTHSGDPSMDEESDVEDLRLGTPVVKLSSYPTRYLDITVDLRDVATQEITWRLPNCQLDEVEIDIRVFDLQNRQPANVKVGVAREYLRKFGGVGVYDGGFRLPYYGADEDWLDIERAHAARLSTSRLVPRSLQVERGLHDLPTNRRLFGRVFISTSKEAAIHSNLEGAVDPEALAVQVTRDRLVDNAAYQRLRVIVRAALDAYAMEQARTRLVKARGRRLGSARQPSVSFNEIRSAIQDAKPKLPPATFRDLDRAVSRAVVDAERIEEVSRAHAALLGALATAGITAIAYEHEISKQVVRIKDLAKDLGEIANSLPAGARRGVEAAVTGMNDWVIRANGIRGILSPLMDEESRTAKDRFSARTLVHNVAKQVQVLSRGIPIDTSKVPADLKLPLAALPAWSAVFQNLYVNAFNALLETHSPKIYVDAAGSQNGGWVRVQDNGVGVDLEGAERLWEPFERGRRLSPEVAALRLGGTGLGLTIVRMITDELGAQVSFTEPESGYSTAVTVSWGSGT